MNLSPIQTTCLGAIQEFNSSSFAHDPFPEEMIMAICSIESSFRPTAYRAEPRISDASYGVMQVLGKTAKWLGHSGDPSELYDPRLCIYFGMKLLMVNKGIITKHIAPSTPTTSQLVASYNCGAGNVLHGYLDHDYVNKWSPENLAWKIRLGH